MASACIAGWPDEPDSPLQSGTPVTGGVTALVVGDVNRLRRSKPCASAPPATVAPRAIAPVIAPRVTAPKVTAPRQCMDRNKFAMCSARCVQPDVFQPQPVLDTRIALA